MADDFQVDTLSKVLAFVMAALSGIGSYWFKKVDSDIKEIKTDLSSRGERLKAVETSINAFDRRFDRIETKIDLLLEKKS